MKKGKVMRFVVVFLIFCFYPVKSKIPTADEAETIEKIRMNAEQYKRVEKLHLNIYASTVLGLIGAIGRDVKRKLDNRGGRRMIRCLEEVDETDLQSGAKCIIQAWDRRRLSVNFRKHSDSFVVSDEKPQRFRPTPRLLKYQNAKFARRKRSLGDFGQISENTDDFEAEEKFHPIRTNKPPALFGGRTSADSALALSARLFLNIIRAAKNSTNDDGKHNLVADLQKLRKLVAIHSEARRFKRSLADLVLDRRRPVELLQKRSSSERLRAQMPANHLAKPLMEHLYGLMDAVEKNDGKLNFKFLSPKFGSLVKDQRDNMGQLLSPNLFPMYKDRDAVLAVPDVLDAVGLGETEKSAFMELILEATSANELIGDALQIFDSNATRPLTDQINNVTKLMTNRFADITENLSGRQRNQMAEKEFTFLNRQQLEKLYGPKGLTTDMDIDWETYEQMTETQKHTQLISALRRISKGVPLAEAGFGFPTRAARRRKREGPTPAILEFPQPAIILSPFVFSPEILSVSILGPTLISPSLFSPGILSPFVLSPVILSPSIGNPLILSPYVLSPKILSPEIFAAYILNPYVLSPNILNPFVMSPLVLSPHVMCPDILSPTVLSGIVLNPYVMSPAFLTESAFVFDILSPSFLS